MNEPKYHKDQSVTAEANKLVYGDRGDSYAHPLTDYEATAKIWSGILGKEVTPYQAALCMVGVKLSRASRNVGHRDSLVDGAGYFEVANEINLAEKDKKQPKVVAWDLAKPKCKFTEGDTVIVHDLPAPNQKYNGKVYKVMGDWGPDCVFVGDDTGERLAFYEKNLLGRGTKVLLQCSCHDGKLATVSDVALSGMLFVDLNPKHDVIIISPKAVKAID